MKRTRIILAVVILVLIYTTVWQPFWANHLGVKSYMATRRSNYAGAKELAERSMNVKSPFTYFEIRKRIGWQFYNLTATRFISEEEMPDVIDFYKMIIIELETMAQYQPNNSQIYYLLGLTYRMGFERFGQDDLGKGEIALMRGIGKAEKRIELYYELAKNLIYQGRAEEGLKVIEAYNQIKK